VQPSRIDLNREQAGLGVPLPEPKRAREIRPRSIFETNFFGLVRMKRAVVPKHATPGEWSHHKHRRRAWPSADAYGALRPTPKHEVEGYSESPPTSSVRVASGSRHRA